MSSINSQWNLDNRSIEIDWILFLRDLWVNHPYGRVCCKTRRNILTLCDGTCGDCKRKITEFTQNEPLRNKANDIISNWGDPTYEHLALEIYQKNLAQRTIKWQKQKQEIIAAINQQESDKKVSGNKSER